MNIGFIGLGGMGQPMAAHLLAAGHDVTVWARRAASVDFLVGKGAVLAAHPVALARVSEIVCTNVTAGPDVVGLAEQLIDGLAPGSIHVDFSTIAPALAQDIAARYATRGIEFVDAPVSGGTAGAQAATLAIMWGGKSTLAPRLAPLFHCLGKTVVHVGEVGAGQVAKICNQLVMVSAIEACAEAARLSQSAGVDFTKVRAAMLAGSAGSRVLDFFGGKMAARDFAAGVQARLHHKDFVMALDTASRAGVPLPVAGSVMQQLDALMAAGWGHDDTSRLMSVLEKAA